MAGRSLPVIIGLLITPTIVLVVFRMSLPVIDSILVSNRVMLIGIHALAALFGLILAGRGNKNKDHEFLRSGAIDRLSRTYELEDGGLWSRADEALARLERRNSKKKPIEMSGGVASINAESRELDLGDEEPGSIRVSGVEVSAEIAHAFRHRQTSRVTSSLAGLLFVGCVGLKEASCEAMLGMLHGEEGLLRCPRP